MEELKEKKDTNKENNADKNKKSDSITIEGITYTEIYENTNMYNEEYFLEDNTFVNNCNIKTDIFIMYNHGYLNNSIFNSPLTVSATATVYINNCILNGTFNYRGTVYIDENTTFGENFNIGRKDGTVYTNNTNFITISTEEPTIENMTITESQSFMYSNTKIINCTINAPVSIFRCNITIINSHINSSIYNTQGILIIDDLSTFGSNFQFSSWEPTKETLIMNNTERIGIYQGNKTYNNINIDKNITIDENSNITLKNSNISAKITNNGNLTLINCSLSNNNMIVSTGKNGYLLDNFGQLSMIDCIVENNTFNTSDIATPSVVIGSPISNHNKMNIINSNFNNNTVGYSIVTGSFSRGTPIGYGIIGSGATVIIENSTFRDNYAGANGGAIYNVGTIIINNTLFVNNTAGRQGGAIFSSGNVTITKSNFTKNNMIDIIYTSGEYIGGGAISISSGTADIKECTFTENYVEAPKGLMSVAAYGGAIGSNGGNINIEDSKFTNHNSEYGSVIHTKGTIYDYKGGTTNVTNCIIENNKGNYVMLGGNYKNNTFQNNDATYLIQNPENISNNKFINNSLSETMITSDTESVITSTNNIYINDTINDTVVLNVPSKIYTGEPITITGTYTINNPEYYDADILEQNQFNVYINGELDQTIDELEFTVTPTAGTMMVTVQPTISQTRKTQALRATTLTDITVTPENYNEYIYEGVIVGVGQNTKIKFSGEFTDKGQIVIDTNDIILNGKDANFTNTSFIIDASNVIIENMNIKNTNTPYPIESFFENNTIQNNNITIYNTNGATAAIYAKSSNTLITNNTIDVKGPAGDIDWEADSSGICTTQAILVIESENNTITYNNITVNGTNIGETFGTIEAITNSRIIKNSLIAYNNITVTGGYFNYAINQLDRINNSTVTDNNILSIGFRYADGIQIGDNATDILIARNNITCICLNDTPVDEAALTYGIITTCQGGDPSDNFTITENNINLTGVINYGMEIYKTTNTKIYNNNITLNGQKSMGIGYCHSPDSTITQNTIIINDKNITTTNAVTEEIQPQTTGIKIQDSEDITINENTIIINDTNKEDTTIDTESSNTIITNNKLISTQGYGDETITAPTTVTLQNNIIETTTTLEDITGLKNTPITLTATVTDEFENNVNGGSVIFTDADGNTIATAEVIDGTASTTATFTTTGETTITATYTPTSTGLTTSTAETSLVIKDKLATTITIDEITATAGETITITANVQDENADAVTAGKVTFKVNGKTLKDENGKVIYAKVVDGVATATYDVPLDASGKDLNITAVYSGSSKYDKQTTTTTLTVEESTPTLTITPFNEPVTTGSTVTLKAKVALGDTPITTGKVVFKVNGKTVKDANGKVIYAKVDANGEVSVDYTIPESFKAGTYNIEAIFTASGYEKLTDNTTMTVVKS